MNRLSHLLLRTLFLYSAAGTVHGRGRHPDLWESSDVNWDESFEAFVPYPQKAIEGLPNERSQALSFVTLDIVANVGQWEQPLFALLQGIVARNHRVVSKHHFFIQDGWIYNHTTGVKSECRKAKDSDAEVVEYQAMGWENCTRHCTNGGRYCLNHGDVSGAPLVKEAARRMCFDYYIEPGSLTMWDYIDRFENATCHENESEMEACSFAVIDAMDDVEKSDIVDCIQFWGDFNQDVKNQGLKHELSEEGVFRVNQNKAQKELPILEINRVQYTGKYHVKDMFLAVCDAFPQEERPYACDFCGGCKDVRKCLWHMECDGEPLDLSGFHPIPTPAPTPRPTSKYALPPSTAPSHHPMSQWQVGFLWGTIVGLLVAIVFAYKEFKTRALVTELANNRHQWEDDFEPRNIDALVESLDTKSTGTSPVSPLTDSQASSMRPFSNSARSTPPVSDDESDISGLNGTMC